MTRVEGPARDGLDSASSFIMVNEGSRAAPAGFYLLHGILALALVPQALASYPQSGACLSENDEGCADLSQKKSDLRVCDESTCRYGGVCRDDGTHLKCVCQFQCPRSYVPVCGSNGDTYQNECYLSQAACKQQSLITMATKGPCYADHASGSGDVELESSGSDPNRKFTKCSTCKYGAECDEDSEDVWCICNIDCSGHNENPVCGSDGQSYSNPCLVREASCMKQEQIDVKHLGRCSDKTGKKDDGSLYKPDFPDTSEPRGGVSAGSPTPCTENYASFCVHGVCEMKNNVASCRCNTGYSGLQCEEMQDFNVLYVVPSGQKLHYVLIAAVIAAVQIAVIITVVMCITRKCPKKPRGRRHKQNLGRPPPDSGRRIV
ncbi:tomoregulin-1 [Chanos chanos]|uniref:Tomoregulin-1 n=1 Tax=Chanos chanos TaxID=29144 RepID=A0A6J2VBA0_CHACN|nr:tomoregulin-1-like [Chanos chanos]